MIHILIRLRDVTTITTHDESHELEKVNNSRSARLAERSYGCESCLRRWHTASQT
jgi:hypothetical protein